MTGFTRRLQAAPYNAQNGNGGIPQPTINPGQPNPNKTWQLTFEDDFNGTSLDTTKWVVSNNTQRNGLTTLASNVSVANSEVRLQLSTPDLGSEITTGYMDNPSAVKYAVPVGGFTEARVWFPGNGSGSVNTGYYNWSAWWTTGDPWPNAGEHDIAEILEDHLTTNYHYGTNWSTDHQQINWDAPAGYWGNGWHIYGVYIGPTTATIYWDGVAVRTYTRQDTGTPQTLVLNAGKSSTNYMAGLAGALRCDWVRAWEPVNVTPAPTPVLSSRVVGIDGTVNTQTQNATSVRLKMSTDAAGTTGVLYGPATTPDANGVAEPAVSPSAVSGVRYYYRVAMTDANGVETLDSDSVVGRIKIAPTGAANFAFNFGSCCAATDSASMAAIAARGDDLFFHLGDLWYADGSGTSVANFITKMGEKVNVTNHKAVFSTTPTTYTPSDHDAGMNNNSNAGTDATALANFNTAHRRFFPSPPEMPATNGLYYSFMWGRVLFINIDCRSFASNPADTDNSSKTVLGSTQKAWLKSKVSNTTAAVICIIGDTAWNGAPVAGDDAWMGYSTERTELINYFNGTGKNYCYLGGDQHALSYDDGTLNNSSGGMVSFQAAPLNNNTSQKAGPWSGRYPNSGSTVMQLYARIAVTDTGSAITFAYTGYSSDNTVRLSFSKTW